MIGRLTTWRMLFAGMRQLDGESMGLLKKLCDILDLVWEDYLYDRASELPSLFEVANIDARWLPFLKPLLGFTQDLSFDATEAELRRILTRAVPFWNDKPSELGSVTHAIRMVTGNRFRVRNYFDHRIAVDETCVTEELEDFDPTCIGFPSRCARGLTVWIGQEAPGQPLLFMVTAGLDRRFETETDYAFLYIEEPEQYRGACPIARCVPGGTVPVGYAHAIAPGSDPWPALTVETAASLYGHMDEYISEVRVVDNRAGVLDVDQIATPFSAGEKLQGLTSGARADVLSATVVGNAGSVSVARVFRRFEDNEVVAGSLGGAAVVNGKMREILNRDLLRFLLEVNRPSGERYDVLYISFLDQFEVPNDLDQWTHDAAITVPAPGGAAVIPAGASMVCNDPHAPRTTSDGWEDYTAKWKVVASSLLTSFGLDFRVVSATRYLRVLFSMVTKTLALQSVDGAVTTIATSAVQPFLKPGVQDLVTVDVFTTGVGTAKARVLLDGEPVISWQDFSTNANGGPVGVSCTAGSVSLKLVEVCPWPLEVERVGPPPLAATHYAAPA